MLGRFVLILTLYTLFCDLHPCYGEETEGISYKLPTVGISVLIRNKGHTLPYFLSCLYNLDYPKDRLYLWIYSDHNEDNSIEIVENWINKYRSEYSGVYITTNSTSGPLHKDEKGPTHWSPEHFKHVIKLREQALDFGRRMWADYIFMLDADVFLTNPSTLHDLVSKQLEVVAPMLVSDGLYSNFWCKMTDNYYYERTDEYKPIQKREKLGCFDVPMVNTAVLIFLRSLVSDKLTYDPAKVPDYDGPNDDIIAFAVNAKKNGVALHVCNEKLYGFVPIPLEENDDLKNDNEQLLNIKLKALSRGSPLALDGALQGFVTYPQKWKFGLDEIFMINLERRTARRQMMESCFKELGMDVKHFNAVDGRNLDMNQLQDMSISLLPGYEDPYNKRPLKAGEVGCFLSHYHIWEEIVERQLAKTLVLEDDIYFVPYFRNKFLQLLSEIEELDWDLVYIGRKILQSAKEESAKEENAKEENATDHTIKPHYSYWTLGYLLSERGARKLLDARPLNKLLPVDEFLPIMFDRHPNTSWVSHFPVRNLIAYSAAPLLVHPTHYTGEEGHFSDTEDSPIVTEQPLWDRNEL